MAMRKPRTNNRPSTKSTQQGTVEREEDGGERGGATRKRKLSDMLGPSWSKEDLELFYVGYRKYGRDWKKVAKNMQERTIEMVEALYSMNRAYLSLPEGEASAAGLIAMMTDRYKDESEEESKEFGSCDRPHQTQSQLGNRALIVSNSNPGPSGYGGPSPAKKPRSAAANRSKRTPRLPPGITMEQKGKNKMGMHRIRQEDISDEDNDVTKGAVVALTLITASQQPASPLISKHTPRRFSSAILQNGHAKESSFNAESGGSGPKHNASASGEGPTGSHEEEPGKASSCATVDETQRADGPRGQASDGKRRGRKPPAKKSQNIDVRCDEPNEQSSPTGTPEKVTRENDEEKHIPGQKKKQQSSQTTKKRSRQLFIGGGPSLDALYTLADISINEENRRSSHSESDGKDESKPQRSGSNIHLVKGPLEKSGVDDDKGEGHKRVCEDEKQKCQTDKDDMRVSNGPRQLSTSPPDSRKRKRKTFVEKIVPPAKFGPDDQERQSQAELQVAPPKVETPVVLKPRRKPKRLATAKTASKQGLKVNKAGDTPGQNLESSILGPVQCTNADQGSLPLKLRSKKKGVPERRPMNGFGDVSTKVSIPEIVKAPHCPHTTAELGPFNAMARLTHCLSPIVRRWCLFEFFYSAIDLPWFARNEFVEYLNHAGLGCVRRLTRTEWGVVRSSLGKPRRLSNNFMHEEREKLEKYREDVRSHYHELRGGLHEGLPSDLARPLSVGQRVIAMHPKSGQIHDGSILTVDRSKCRVQFDRPELGVEFVADINAMPMHPLDNMPEVMRRKRIILDAVDRTSEDSRLEVKSRVAVSAGGAARAALFERLERPGSTSSVGPFSQGFLNSLMKTVQINTVESVRIAKAATTEAIAAHYFTQAKDTDYQALVGLSDALNHKEKLVVDLCRMNEDAASYNKGSEALQRQYAKLRDVNEQVSLALKYLRHRNKYQDSGMPIWHQGPSQVAIGGPSPAEVRLPGSLEAASVGISDIAASSKKYARAMVSAAVESMSALKEGEDPLAKMDEALDLVTRGTQGNTAGVACTTEGLGSKINATSATNSPTAVDKLREADESAKCDRMSHKSLPGHAPTVNITDASTTERLNHGPSGETKEAPILSELVASCVATLLMVQTFSEGPFSAPDVALALDSALETLRPQHAQNHCIYKDIEQQLGYIKTQILSQVPIQSSIPFPVEIPIAQPNPT